MCRDARAFDSAREAATELGSKLAKGHIYHLHVMSGLCIFFDYFVLSTGWSLGNYKAFT